MPEWVRCRDRDTGHEFDLSPEDIRVQDGSVEVLQDYPENASSTAQPRPAKYRVDKSGQPLESTDEPPADEQPVDDTEAVESADTKEK